MEEIVPERAHALLPPSGAETWLTCLGSTLLGKDEPNRSSSYAEEGTDYHTLAAVCLDEGKDAAEYIGHPMESGNRVVTEEGAKQLQEGYLDYIRQYAVGGSLLVEERCSIEHLTGEPKAKGTSDAVVIRVDPELFIGDLKWGMGVEVDPERNKQCMIYALGVIGKHDLATLVETIRIVIFQPRIGDGKPKEWVVSMKDLLAFGETVKKTAKQIVMFDEQTGAATWTKDLPLTPSPKACKFCKANGICPALRNFTRDRMDEGFENLDAKVDPDFGELFSRAEVLGRAMDGIDLIEIYMKGVQAAVEAELLAGKPVHGADGPYKLVQGKKGNRKWTSEEDVVELFDQFRLPKKDRFKSVLISPTDAEKLFKKENPRCWIKCEKIITQSEGAPHVANAKDKRPELVMQKPDEGFDKVEDWEEFL